MNRSALLLGLLFGFTCCSPSEDSSGKDAATRNDATSADAQAEAEADAGVDVDVAADAATDVCIATDPATLLACAASAQAGTTTAIEIRGTITCTGVDACKVHIDTPPKALTIRGQAGSLLRRLDHYDYPLIAVLGTTSIIFSDLVIDELESAACDPISATNPPVDNPLCKRSIDIYAGGSVTLERDTILHSKREAVFVNGAHDVHVIASRFVDAHLFGLIVTGVADGVIIEQSLFEDGASNALVLADVHGTSTAPAFVRQNIFEHNHRKNLFYSCGSGNDPCDGGQLYLASAVDWLTISGNAIRDGSSDTNPTTNNTSGIEVNDTPDIHDVLITGNDMHNDNQSAVTFDGDPADVVRVSIADNKFYGNGGFYTGANTLNFPAGAETGTCTTAGCKTVALGAMWPIPGSGVGWETNDLVSPTVKVGSATVSSLARGTTAVAAGLTATLLDGTTFFDSQVAR